MTEGIAFFLILVVAFSLGYYIVPWIMYGDSPKETWRRDHE